MKQAKFHPKAGEVARKFPQEVKTRLGAYLMGVQNNQELPYHAVKPMSSVALGTFELRIHDTAGAYRVFYFTKHEKAILVFHAFVKKTRTTSKSEIALGKKRLQEMIDEIG